MNKDVRTCGHEVMDELGMLPEVQTILAGVTSAKEIDIVSMTCSASTACLHVLAAFQEEELGQRKKCSNNTCLHDDVTALKNPPKLAPHFQVFLKGGQHQTLVIFQPAQLIRQNPTRCITVEAMIWFYPTLSYCIQYQGICEHDYASSH